MKKLNKISKKIKNRFNEISEMSKELTMGLPKIVVLGNKECMIENYQGIIEYESQKIRLKTKIGDVSIEGKELKINEIGEGEMLIIGEVKSLLLEGED